MDKYSSRISALNNLVKMLNKEIDDYKTRFFDSLINDSIKLLEKNRECYLFTKEQIEALKEIYIKPINITIIEGIYMVKRK